MFAEFPSEGRQYCIRWIVLEKKLKEECVLYLCNTGILCVIECLMFKSRNEFCLVQICSLYGCLGGLKVMCKKVTYRCSIKSFVYIGCVHILLGKLRKRKQEQKHFVCYRDSIIPVGGGAGAVDYNNVSPNRLSLLREERERLATFAGQEEALYTNPEKIVATLNLEVQKKNRAVSDNQN